MKSKSRGETSGRRTPIIWAVGGCKGGIGKSFFTSNMGMVLAGLGFKTMLIDFDLGGANLHTWLGVQTPDLTLSDFFSEKKPTLEEIAVETGTANLRLINGAHDIMGMANLKHGQKTRLINAIRRLPYDYVLLDLGSGTSYNMIDFFLAADKGFIVVTPEPVAVENAYRFIKAAYYRNIRNCAENLTIRQMVSEIMERNLGKEIRTPFELMQKIEELDPIHGALIMQAIQGFQPNIVVNQVRESGDLEIGRVMVNASRKFFGIEATLVGHVNYDEEVWRSIRARRPFIKSFPEHPLGKQIAQIVGNSLNVSSDEYGYQNNADRLL